jgi:hypothetical protein
MPPTYTNDSSYKNTFARIATSNFLALSAPLFKKLNILSIYNNNVRQLCTFIYKYSYLPNSLPKPFNGFFQVHSEIHLQNITQVTVVTVPLTTGAAHIVRSLSDVEVPYSGILIFTLPKHHHPSITSS